MADRMTAKELARLVLKLRVDRERTDKYARWMANSPQARRMTSLCATEDWGRMQELAKLLLEDEGTDAS